MDDEFKLCWKNFQDNIASGFQNLYDRGDLVDVTLACDGKLLQAHKIVLAICSPYFQEIFTTNPCQHPIIILKDVSFNIMGELLEFMYQGVVNVKHTELQSFMKIGQLLQIKGLATNSSATPEPALSEKSTSQHTTERASDEVLQPHNNSNNATSSNNLSSSKSETEHIEPQSSSHSHSGGKLSNPRVPLGSPGGHSNSSNYSKSLCDPQPYQLSKRYADNDSLSIYTRKQLRRSLTTDHVMGAAGEPADTPGDASMEALNADEFFLPPIPHISMVEPRYELGGVKREAEPHGAAGFATSSSSAAAAAALRNSFGSVFSLDYNMYKPNNSSANSVGGSSSSGGGGSSGGLAGSNNGNAGAGASGHNSTEYPNELYMTNDYKNFGNHMDIPPNGSNMVMLSTTSLLHGSCVFNRNNTVATQQGMKTYWLCKSYRISMCRARCITHLGRIISATGVHNHTPHMRGGSNGSGSSSNSTANHVTITPNPQPHQANPSLCSASDGSLNNAPHIAPPTSVAGVEMNHQVVPSIVSSSHSNTPNSHCARLGLVGANMFANQASAPTVLHQHATAASHQQHHHVGQALPNLLVQHHTNALHSMEQHGMAAGAAATPNSVIQNIMHNPNLMHLPMQQQQHHQHQQQHSPHTHHTQQQHHLELGAAALLPLSPAHIQQQSPQSNRSSQSLHATESPICMKSPSAPAAVASHVDVEQHAMVHNAAPALSPADINSNTAGSTEAAPSASAAHVIDSITISPSNGHNFKIENM